MDQKNHLEHLVPRCPHGPSPHFTIPGGGREGGGHLLVTVPPGGGGDCCAF